MYAGEISRPSFYIKDYSAQLSRIFGKTQEIVGRGYSHAKSRRARELGRCISTLGKIGDGSYITLENSSCMYLPGREESAGAAFHTKAMLRFLQIRCTRGSSFHPIRPLIFVLL